MIVEDVKNTSFPEARVDASVFLEAFQRIQEETAKAHAEFQKTMSEAHQAYLQNAEAGLKELAKAAEASLRNISESDSPFGFEKSQEIERTNSPEGANNDSMYSDILKEPISNHMSNLSRANRVEIPVEMQSDSNSILNDSNFEIPSIT